ncbi:MAG: phenylalanine--tRNA ligase subunit beta [Candidatus Symbiobacter sp.]|nr:phenylalanine--tRNA ligase subunit beta [Candidatus Symbiobacter sp.]
MKLSRSWLNHVTQWPVMTSPLGQNWHGLHFAESDEVIAATLTKLGFEVEAIEKSGQTATAEPTPPDLSLFTVGEIISAEQHPQADRLRVCQVATLVGTLQVVCGAPNARAGIKIAFAPVGSVIPRNGLKLKKSTIRGVESNGMCCSAWELNLSEDHEGIIELFSEAKIGEPVTNYLKLSQASDAATLNQKTETDTIFEIAITPNRADGLGVQGIRREIFVNNLGKCGDLGKSGDLGKTSDPKSASAPNTTKPSGESGKKIAITITADARPYCPHFVGQMVENVHNQASPDWLVALLASVGHKSISTLVDVTNYMMLEANRPLHVFDADKIRGNLVVRLAESGEKLTALNGKTYELPAGAVVIADESGIISLGGVMGGESTAVSLATKNVLIEAAWFDPARVAATGRALAIISDARHRFERGIDTDSAVPGVAAAAAMVLDLCGGTAGGRSEAGAPPICRKALTFRPSRVAALGGIDVPLPHQQEILAGLGFAVTAPPNAASWQVMPPAWRLECEGEADLVEEILRHYGLDAMAAVPLPRPSQISPQILSPAETNRIKTRRLLAARGLHEAVTWAFMDKERATLFGGGGDDLTLSNPIAADLSQMRPTPLPNLLAAAARQVAHGEVSVSLFEIGPGFHNPTPKGQQIIAAGIRLGARQSLWRREAAFMPAITGGQGAFDVFDAKSDMLAVLELLGFAASSLQISNDATAAAANYYHPGQSGLVKLGDKIVLAKFGMIHPSILAEIDLAVPVAAFEILLDAIPPAKNKGKSTAKPPLALSAMQKFTRDFAFIVDDTVAAERLLRASRAADKNLVETADIFDVYYGDKLPRGKKSLAIRVTIAPMDRAMNDAEIADLEQKIIAAVGSDCGGELRG